MACKREWQVADLNQLVRTGRARFNTVEGHLPTLTTNSGKLWSKVLVGSTLTRDYGITIMLFILYVLTVQARYWNLNTLDKIAPQIKIPHPCTGAQSTSHSSWNDCVSLLADKQPACQSFGIPSPETQRPSVFGLGKGSRQCNVSALCGCLRMRLHPLRWAECVKFFLWAKGKL